MSALLMRTARRLAHALAHVSHEILVIVWVFWCIQCVGWMIMMCVVQFFDRSLGSSVLYVTQISHWALVEAAGAAALSSWTLIQARHSHDLIAQQTHQDAQPTKEGES